MNKQELKIPIIATTPEVLRQLIAEEMDKRFAKFEKAEAAKDLPEHMTAGEVAKFYNVTTETVYNWDKNPKIKLTRRMVEGVIRYDKTEVLNLKK